MDNGEGLTVGVGDEAGESNGVKAGTTVSEQQLKNYTQKNTEYIL